ncbi:hypothetical protein EYY98_10630 [Obesumbacterium proteus]|nr:hypothetical protein EYY98_10630 [Obesumbacterium proteus]
MTSREQFEAWWNADEQEELRKSCAMGWGLKIWQASREAVEVELPEEMKAREALDKGFMCDYAAGVTDTVVQMRENLRAAGIKVKGE